MLDTELDTEMGLIDTSGDLDTELTTEAGPDESRPVESRKLNPEPPLLCSSSLTHPLNHLVRDRRILRGHRLVVRSILMRIQVDYSAQYKLNLWKGSTRSSFVGMSGR